MNKIEEASVQASHIKNGLEAILYNLYDMKTDDLEKNEYYDCCTRSD